MADLSHVKGLSELLATMRALPPEFVSRGGGPVRVALRAAAIVIQQEARANVRRIVDEPNKDGQPSASTGLLEKSIIVSRGRPFAGMKGEVYRVRVRRGAKNAQGVSANKYGGILEFGDETRKAWAWMRAAFETKKSEALATFESELRKRIDGAVKKAQRASRRAARLAG